MATVTASAITTNEVGVAVLSGTSNGSTTDHRECGTAETARTIASQFSHAKLPLATSHSCVTIITPAQIPDTGCGANNPNGITSCVTWFAATSTRCSGFGS